MHHSTKAILVSPFASVAGSVVVAVAAVLEVPVFAFSKS